MVTFLTLPPLSRTDTREILIVRVTRARAQLCLLSFFYLCWLNNRKTRVSVRDGGFYGR